MFRSNSNWKQNRPTRKNKVYKDSLRNNLEEFIRSNKLILKLLQRFRNKKQNELTEEVNTISLYANNEIYIQ